MTDGTEALFGSGAQRHRWTTSCTRCPCFILSVLLTVLVLYVWAIIFFSTAEFLIGSKAVRVQKRMIAVIKKGSRKVDFLFWTFEGLCTKMLERNIVIRLI